jgi:hypothetical protein
MTSSAPAEPQPLEKIKRPEDEWLGVGRSLGYGAQQRRRALTPPMVACRSRDDAARLGVGRCRVTGAHTVPDPTAGPTSRAHETKGTHEA